MKVLVLLFLIGCATAYTYDDALDQKVDEVVNTLLGDAEQYRLYRADDDSKSELEQKVREAFDRLLEKVKEAIDHGKVVREDVIEKLKELRQKLKDLKVDIGEKAKELIAKLKEKAKDYLDKLLERLGLKEKNEKRTIFHSEIEELFRRAEEDDSRKELEQRIREKFDRILELIKDAMSKGKLVREDMVKKLNELREKMRDLKVEMSKKGKELLEKIRSKVKDYLSKLWERLGLKDDKETRAILYSEVEELFRRDEDKDLEQRVRDQFDQVMEKVKDALEKGKALKEDTIEKLKNLREKMKEMKIDMSEKAKEMLQKIKEKAKDFLQKLLDKLGLKDNKETRAILHSEVEELFRRDDSKDLEQKVRESFDQILEKIKDALEKGKGIKEEYIERLKNLREKLKEMKIDMGEKAKELLQKIKEKAKDFIQKLLDKLGQNSRETRAILHSEVEELFERAEGDETEKELKDRFGGMLEKLKEYIEKGKGIKEDFIQKFKDLRQKLKDRRIDVTQKFKDFLRNLKDKVSQYIKDLLEKLGGNKEEREARAAEFDFAVEELIRRADEKSELEQKLREKFDSLLEKVKEAIEKGKTVREDVIEKIKEVKEKMKEMKIDMSEKARELFEKIKEKARDFLRNLLDKLGNKEQQSIARVEFDIKSIFKKLKEALKEKIDKEAIKEKIEKIFGKGNEFADKLIELLKEKKEKLLKFIDKILEEKEKETEKRSLQENFEKVREYFKKLGIELKEKYHKLGEWVKENLKKALDKSKTKIENVKAIAREFLEHSRDVGKEVAVDVVDFLRPYRDDLEGLYERVKEKVQEILKRED